MNPSAAAHVGIVRLGAPSDLRRELARDARAGLTGKAKELPPKYFYDARGSELFERITLQPEYYPTRAELAILDAHADEIMELARAEELVEIGSGSSRKTRLLIEALGRHGGRRYVPIDVSEAALYDAAQKLRVLYPWLEIEGAVGDFEHDLDGIARTGRRLVAFLGSTIGNLEVEARVPFLRSVRTMLEDGDHFLLGVDLVKDRRTLEAAYNDAQGVTAAFNLNVLDVVNRELDGDLPVEAFEHRAFYDDEEERIEMRLRARRAVHAHLGRIDLDVDFEPGEELRTEISCKFRREAVEETLRAAGLVPVRWFTDPERRFAVALAARAPGNGRAG